MESMKHAPSGLSIMIVDDDREASRIIGLITAKKFPDANISIAENGQQGLELFEEYRPDIVITDIRMPVMDGIQMAREIKSLKDDTHFIVLTAFNDKESLAEFREIGYCDYLIKPIEFTKLLAGLEKCIFEIRQGRVAKSC
jgi:two-component system, sensor histidine kinase and response regulator